MESLLSPKAPEYLKKHGKHVKYQKILNFRPVLQILMISSILQSADTTVLAGENLIKTPKNHLSAYASAKPSQTENHKHAQPAIFNKFSCKALLYSIFTGSY
jgi:hypothetical protein